MIIFKDIFGDEILRVDAGQEGDALAFAKGDRIQLELLDGKIIRGRVVIREVCARVVYPRDLRVVSAELTIEVYPGGDNTDDL